MKKIKITIEYDGTNYSGWQVQPNAPSIQEAIERALFTLTGEKCKVYGAGRTDSGVHARGQVAVFSSDSSIPPEKYAHALTTRLPKDISVRHSELVDEDFEPRFHAKLKLYRYYIYSSPIAPAIGRQYMWYVKWPLDFALMQQAAVEMTGTHDFTSFSNQECNTEDADNVRTVDSIDLQKKGELITIDVTGQGFLYNMVRNITGTLVDVGTGRIGVDEIAEIFTARDRKKAGQGAPACGLCLEWIKYT